MFTLSGSASIQCTSSQLVYNKRLNAVFHNIIVGNMRMLEKASGRAAFATMLILLGFGFGTIYVTASGDHGPIISLQSMNQFVCSGQEWPELAADEKITLEQQAIDIAFANVAIKRLVEGKKYSVHSSYQLIVRTKSMRQEGNWTIVEVEWDGKHRVLVTIAYDDDSGYYVNVNVTDKTVERYVFVEKIYQAQYR